MIHQVCGSCGNPLEIPDEYAGQAGRCKRCGATIMVPPIPENVPESAPPPPVPEPSLAQPEAAEIAKPGSTPSPRPVQGLGWFPAVGWLALLIGVALNYFFESYLVILAWSIAIAVLIVFDMRTRRQPGKSMIGYVLGAVVFTDLFLPLFLFRRSRMAWKKAVPSAIGIAVALLACDMWLNWEPTSAMPLTEENYKALVERVRIAVANAQAQNPSQPATKRQTIERWQIGFIKPLNKMGYSFDETIKLAAYSFMKTETTPGVATAFMNGYAKPLLGMPPDLLSALGLSEDTQTLLYKIMPLESKTSQQIGAQWEALPDGGGISEPEFLTEIRRVFKYPSTWKALVFLGLGILGLSRTATIGDIMAWWTGKKKAETEPEG